MPQLHAGCPGAETLGAFVEGKLTHAELQIVQKHLAICDECLMLIGEVAAWQRQTLNHPRTAERRRRLFAMKWMIAAAILLCVVALVPLAIHLRGGNSLARLTEAAAHLENRTLEPRLNGFAYRPVPDANRSGRQSFDRGLLKLRAVAADLIESPTESSSADDLHLFGVATLLAGDAATAIERLRSATERYPDDAILWSDLSAAYWEASRNGNDIDAQAVVQSVAAADRALEIDPKNPVARFNRALAIESLHLTLPARRAWNDYLASDSGSGWGNEAHQRKSRLFVPTQIERWKQALPQLEQAVLQGDSATVRAIVRTDLQQARTHSELFFLKEWADAWTAGDTDRARSRLDIARAVSVALAEANRETLLRDAVAAIDTGDTPQRNELAAAHRRYYDGRVLHFEGKTVEALPLFENAMRGFRSGHSPMAYAAEYYIAICQHAAGANDASLATLSRLLSTVPPYQALRAQLLWQRGTDLSLAGLLIEALEAQRASLRLFEDLGENANADLMRHYIAAVEAVLGHDGLAWRMRLDIFRNLSKDGDPMRLQTALEAAARTEAFAQRWDTAHALLNLALDPDLQANHWLYVNALVWRALAAHRLGRHAAATRDLAAARGAATSMNALAVRDEALNSLRLAEAVILRENNPTRTVALLDEYLSRTSRAQNLVLVPEALLERARAYRALRDHDAAIRDLHEALARLDDRRGDQNGFRDAFFATGDSATRELVDLLDARGAREQAFAIAERAQARSIADRLRNQARADVLTSDAIRQVLPRATILVHYVVLGDRVVIFSLGAGGLRIDRVSVERNVIVSEASAFVRLVTARRDLEAIVIAERLYDRLITPVRDRIEPNSTLVIVADPLLTRIPFSALRNRTSNRYLIEETAIVSAPSASVYAALTAKPFHPQPGLPTLIVGNPAIDRSRFDSLPELPYAEKEAAAIGREYRDATVLVGTRATKQRVLQYLGSSSVTHIASHAIAVDAEPAQSFLILAPSDGDSGALYLHEIADTSLEHTAMVALVGCRTSAAVERADVGSLALAFLVAGSRNVVGTLWDVDDAVGHEFSAPFHHALRSGLRPADALREIQLRMLHSSTPELRRLKAWSAFQMTGTGF